jgi:hypothetical protein
VLDSCLTETTCWVGSVLAADAAMLACAAKRGCSRPFVADGESVAGAVPINHKGVARGLIRVGPTRRVGARTAGEWM